MNQPFWSIKLSILFLQFLHCLQLYQSQVQRLACIFSPIFGTPGPGAGPLHYYKYKQYYIAYTSRFSGFCGEKNIWPWVLMSESTPQPWLTIGFFLSKLLLVLVSQLQSRIREMFSLTTTRAYNVLKHLPLLESLFMNTLSSTMLLLN